MYYSKCYLLHHLSFIHFITQLFITRSKFITCYIINECYQAFITREFDINIYLLRSFFNSRIYQNKTSINQNIYRIISSHNDVIYFKFLSHVTKFNILFFNAKTINDFDQTIQNIFFNVFDENSQLFTKNAQTRNSFNIIITTQLQN